MTKLEFCVAVKNEFIDGWPFPGSLSFAAMQYHNKKTVAETVQMIIMEQTKRRQKAERNARRT